MATESLILPRLGETMEEGRIGRWLKKPGESFKRGEVLLELESDKTTVELPALSEGKLLAILVKDGEEAKVGTPIATIETALAGEPEKPVAVPPAQIAAAPGPVKAKGALASTNGRPGLLRATPSARRLAQEEGVELVQVTGTGRRGRIEKKDVVDFSARRGEARATPPPALSGYLPWPKVDFARFGPVRRSALSRIRKVTGANLLRNWVMIPHVTQNDEADITLLEPFREELNLEAKGEGTKVTLLAFVLKACANALAKYPEVNSSLDGGELVLKDYYHLGFAVETANGLVVPVVRDVDRKGVLAIARETAALAKKARDGKLAPDDLQGGTFSVSSQGGIGGTSFTPIINAPEVAILGVSRAAKKPVWKDDGFEPRLMLPLSLSYDHRVIDGAQAARFVAYLSRVLADFRRVVV